MIYVLKHVEAGGKMLEVCRQLGVSLATFYVWKRSTGQMGISELNELRVLRDENGRLQKLAADLSLDKHILQKVLQKKLRPAHLRGFIPWMRESYGLDEKHACELVMFAHFSYYHRCRPRDYTALIRRLRELAGLRVMDIEGLLYCLNVKAGMLTPR